MNDDIKMITDEDVRLFYSDDVTKNGRMKGMIKIERMVMRKRNDNKGV
jgi:hypothetical protein